MRHSKLVIRALALAALLPWVSVIASSDAAAHPFAGGRYNAVRFTRVPVGSAASVQIRRVIIRRFRIR